MSACTHEFTDYEYGDGSYRTYCLNCFKTLSEQTFAEVYQEVMNEVCHDIGIETCEGSWKDSNSCILHTEEEGYFNL